jgi:2-iminobutanoate/2-iminopropanoate deaminase
MEKKALLTDKAPQPIGPYSQAVRVGNLVFVSGQIPIDPATGELVQGDIATQTRRTLDSVMAILSSGGLGPENVVRTSVYLADMKDFAAMNEVYATYFKGVAPARSCIQAARLPKDVSIEVDVIAAAE